MALFTSFRFCLKTSSGAETGEEVTGLHNLWDLQCSQTTPYPINFNSLELDYSNTNLNGPFVKFLQKKKKKKKSQNLSVFPKHLSVLTGKWHLHGVSKPTRQRHWCEVIISEFLGVYRGERDSFYSCCACSLIWLFQMVRLLKCWKPAYLVSLWHFITLLQTG